MNLQLVHSAEPVTGVTAEKKRCKCCQQEWPATLDYFCPNNAKTRASRGLPPTLQPYCRACHSGNKQTMAVARFHRGEVTRQECGARATEWFLAAKLGIRRKSKAQTDISIECAKAGVEPGRDLRKSRLAASPEQVAELRQTRFEKQEAQPAKESRQVRRARERRLVKDARAAFTRVLTPAEATSVAIDRAMSARNRATGKASAPRVRKPKVVRWNLTPEETHTLMRTQDYRCALTGEPFKESTEFGTSDPFSPSPNRINPGGDYLPENCEFVCWWVNRAISDMPRHKALEFLSERKLLRRDFRQPGLFTPMA